MIENKQKKCWLPWRMFRIMSDGDATMCCSNQLVIGNIFRQSFEKIWNSENALNFRALIAEEKYVEAGCAACSFWYTFHPRLFEIPENGIALTAAQRQNRALQEDEFAEGKTRLESHPALYFVQPSYFCNINCIMCNQKQARLEPSNSLVVRGNLVEYLDGLEIIPEMLIMQGGETLLVPEIIQCLEKIAVGHPDMTVHLNTNGTIFHRREALLKRIPNLNLNFSIDAGSKDIYKKIRVGGDWEQLVKNLDRAVQISQQSDNNWSVNIQNVIMKSNIEHVPEIVRFGLDHAPQQKVYPVAGIDNETENIFIFNHLLDETPRWRESLNNAQNLAKQTSLVDLQRGLEYIQELLDCNPKLSRDIFQFLKQALSRDDFYHFYQDISNYKIAYLNGFVNDPFDLHFQLKHHRKKIHETRS